MTEPEDEFEPGGSWDGYLSPKVWVPALFVVAIALLGMGVFLVMNTDDDGTPGGSVTDPNGNLRQPTHEHADFALFIRGEQFDFNQPEFLVAEDESTEATAHIHPPRPSIIHVHIEQTTWSEFFESIGFEFLSSSMTLPDGTRLENTETETFKFFMNGVQIDSLYTQYITNLDQVLISYGPETADEVRETQLPLLTDEACIVSGLCAERGTPEDEPCTGQGQCS